MSYYKYILLSVDKPVFRYDFHPKDPLILGKDPEIGLKSIFIWYTLPNISPKYKNDTVRLFYNDQWHDVKIPTGLYEVEKLSEFLNRSMVQPEPGEPVPRVAIRLDVDTSTFHCYVKLAPGYKIDFSQGDLHKLLGLEAKMYDQSYERGPNILNITRGVDRLVIRCNLVERPFQHKLNHVLYDLLPIEDPGAAIMQEVEHVEYYPCKHRIIRSLEMRLTDLDGNLIELTEPYNIKIVFKHGEYTD